jgi:hypothetical protein
MPSLRCRPAQQPDSLRGGLGSSWRKKLNCCRASQASATLVWSRSVRIFEAATDQVPTPDGHAAASMHARAVDLDEPYPHPDSLSAMGTSRTTTPGSSDIYLIACSVSGLPRLAMRRPSKIR